MYSICWICIQLIVKLFPVLLGKSNGLDHCLFLGGSIFHIFDWTELSYGADCLEHLFQFTLWRVIHYLHFPRFIRETYSSGFHRIHDIGFRVVNRMYDFNETGSKSDFSFDISYVPFVAYVVHIHIIYRRGLSVTEVFCCRQAVMWRWLAGVLRYTCCATSLKWHKINCRCRVSWLTCAPFCRGTSTQWPRYQPLCVVVRNKCRFVRLNITTAS